MVIDHLQSWDDPPSSRHWRMLSAQQLYYGGNSESQLFHFQDENIDEMMAENNFYLMS